MQNNKVRLITQSALIAAVYTVLTLALAPLSFGQMQVRVSEALTLLCVFSPSAVIGVTLGCAISNAVGFFTGVNILGAFDIVFGTLATLLAAVCSYLLRNVRVKGLAIPAALPPVIFNALIIGGELMVLISGGFNAPIFLINALWVGLGELVACLVLGVPLIYVLERSRLNRLFTDEAGGLLHG